ncbi:hypothetical protein PTSG_12147 [Salpingoeca rosetta]|uniref:Uncharacterized protein n=1 Tax=Salpingoeca rosetta (strain ATCC 50818 / BSB-021) TaxID=946362 RepID=F2U737_SALR5|nr:uncharacterized protein PTSG_12147 [Salpingoeca rosetta]EGD83669.1 hypothetical protein PTSG_12147 [Salpingoeca rosetta]|eukprot:XP_004995173.1 hypothetical protein PTSG_12147 [Salpingoeca rosetta]
MPGRWSVGQYVALCFFSISSMMLGASMTHNYYKPDLTIPAEPVKPNSVLKKRTVAIVPPRGARDDDESSNH